MTTWPAPDAEHWQFSVLGPLRVWRDGTELDLGPRQARLVLALLVVHAGRFVAISEFVALLWPEDPPARAVNVLHRHIGVLRRVLEPDLPVRTTGRWIDRATGGYRLRVDADSVDLLRARRLAGEGRVAMEQGSPAVALPRFLGALELWRGRCASSLIPDSASVPEFASVDRERSVIALEAADAALARRQPRAVLPALRLAVENDPFDEALQARLLLVLTADGHQAEAVSIYHALRRLLTDELGVEPGRDLRDAYARILQPAPVERSAPEGAAAVDRLGTEKRVAARRNRVHPAQLPAPTRFFTGRDQELAWLTDLPRPEPASAEGAATVVIEGLPGVGKTTLAVCWAHRMTAHFPDGQLFVDLRGFDAGGSIVTPGAALRGLLSALGVAHAEVPPGLGAQSALYRSMVWGRSMLIVLDNARDADHVRPLIPASPGCLVVVTSRNRLTGLATREGAHRLWLDVPPLTEARTGMLRRLGVTRAGAERRALTDIITMCGRLPIAMAVVAARAAALTHRSLTDIATEIRAAGGTLDAFDGDEPVSDVRSVFSWSYRMLSPPAARLFRLLSTHPGRDIGLTTVAALAAASRREATELLAELTRTGLITEHRHQRYIVHDLIRAYARELAEQQDAPADRHEAELRALTHLWRTAYTANSMFSRWLLPPEPPAFVPDVEGEPIASAGQAMAWFAAELSVLEDTLTAASPTDANLGEVALLLQRFYQRTGRYNAWRETGLKALQIAVKAGDLRAQALMHKMVAGGEALLNHHDAASDHLERAQELFEHLGQTRELSNVYCNLSYVRCGLAQIDLAIKASTTAAELSLAEDDRRGYANALVHLGMALSVSDDPTRAIPPLQESAAIFRDTGDDDPQATSLRHLSRVLSRLGRHSEAIEHGLLARKLSDLVDNPEEHVELGLDFGDTYLAAGRPEDAARVWRETLRACAQHGFTEIGATVEARLGVVGDEVGDGGGVGR